jgi:hypothetical protein
MSDFELMFQLFALLLGLSMAELLGGLARSWRIRAGAVRTGEAQIRIGWLVPLFGLLVLTDLTRFWVTAYALRDYLTFDYASLLSMLVIVGGYFAIATFVFPDEPADWPDFDDYFLHTNRIVVGGMIVVNSTILLHGAALAAAGASIEEAPITRSWVSLGAALIYLPSLVVLWFAKSKRANLALLLFANALMLIAAFGPRVLRYFHIGTIAVA